MTQPIWGVPKGPAAVTNSQFLAELARGAANGTHLWVHTFDGNPDGNTRWGGFDYSAATMASVVDRWRDNTYYSVAALKPDGDGVVGRRKANFARLLALVVDDMEVGDLMGSPSYVLETSPGKRQVGFFIDGQDADAADLILVTRLVTRMADRGMLKGDKSGNNAVRWVRLPVGTNQKPRDTGPFAHRVITWSPNTRYSLEDAAACLGIDLGELRAEARQEPAPAGLVEGSQDDRLRILAGNIIRGENLHDSVNQVAASLVASGTHGGTIVNLLRAMMDASLAARDDRWLARYQDIPRSVTTAQEKFAGDRQREAAEAVQQPPEARPLFVRADALLAGLKPISWLVRGILETDALGMVYGPSGVGKSFVTVDLACSIATGTGWHGHETRKGPVFYVAGEGHNGLARRLAAWQQARGISLAGVDLYKSEKAVQLLDRAAALELAAEIEAMVNAGMPPPQAVVIDTLARNFGDGDENTAADAGRFIENVDSLIRRKWACNVLIVHHSGHQADRARGSSAFKAAMDQEMAVVPSPRGMLISVTKMKDAERPADKEMLLDKVIVGVDPETDEPIESAVLKVAGDPFMFVVGRRGDGSEVTCRQVLDVVSQGWENRIAFETSLGVSPKLSAKVLKELANQGVLVKMDGYHGGYEISKETREKLSRVGAFLQSGTDRDDD